MDFPTMIRQITDQYGPPLPAKAQRQLVKEFQEGSKEALDQLIGTNIRFLVSCVYDFVRTHTHVNKEDCLQEAVLGLIKAAERFDHAFKNTFLSYARHQIYASMQRCYVHERSHSECRPKSHL